MSKSTHAHHSAMSNRGGSSAHNDPSIMLERELTAFVLHEARLLDEQRLEDWNALFAPDGWYWLPAHASHTDPLLQASHLYDDRMLREVHIARLRSAQAHSQQSPGQCHHLMQKPQIENIDPANARYRLRTAFIYTELRSGRTVSLPGVAWHDLRSIDGQLRIQLKRVDLLHAAESLPAVEFYV
jgi:3-phenylpropionate/cinnamic acid dioxygenase small subunit